MAKWTRRRIIETGLVGAVAALFILLPVFTGTSNYPLAIVQGNSMYPTLHSGDLVIFGKAPQGPIPNGTIIVFVQGDTGVSSLDSIIRPVVIHRIVGTVVQADGTVYYRTKGDNNEFVDPSLVEANHVLGVPIKVIPGAGLLVLFAESPEGLVAIIGMISLYYVGRYEVRLKEDKAKDTFLGDLTKMMLEGDLSGETFRRLEPVVKYGRNVQLDGVNDGLVISLLTWIKGGALEDGWALRYEDCPKCSARSASFVSSKGKVFNVCPRCSAGEPGFEKAEQGPALAEMPVAAAPEEVPKQAESVDDSRK